MTDINSYANELLIDFLDSTHDQLRLILEKQYGDSWFEDGIERHLENKYFERTHTMLTSPMAIVDMNKSVDELYGVEHLASIIIGNWDIFEEHFKHRPRTEVYFGEITELRHNLSHRRQHHILQRGELWRFVHNARLILSALDSPNAYRMESIANKLAQGGTPWGNQLSGTLPPSIDIVSDFVGRQSELDQLSHWLTTDHANQFMIWGYGGSGKSSLAYKFAQTVRDGAPTGLEAVVWLSAKSQEFMEGSTRERHPDFDDIDSFIRAFWMALYDFPPDASQHTRQALLAELSDTPSLVIVDDLDSVLDHEELAHFLLFELPATKSNFLYTTRQMVPGLQRIDVKGFSQTELDAFLRSCALSYDMDAEHIVDRAEAIHSVTNGFPLFVEDLLRHAMLNGLQTAIDDWSHRKGDAAREYALRRQLSSLGEASRRALIGVAVANRPVSSLELSNISGFTDDDVQQAVRELLGWRLLTRLEIDSSGRPTFSCNRNTQRLVQKTYGQDPLYKTFRSSFKNLSGSTLPPAHRKAVAMAISNARALVLRDDNEGAAESLRAAMTGELQSNADLWGVLGWVLSRDKIGSAVADARAAFQRSHELDSKKEDTYFHWANMEIEIAEGLINQGDDEDLLKQWRSAARVAELGIERCGETPSLCQMAAYLRNREAKTLERANQFTPAQGCYRQAAHWIRRAIAAPNAPGREVHPSQLYRTLIIAHEGAGDHVEVIEALNEWEAAVGSNDLDFRREKDRLGNYTKYRDHIS